MGNIVLLDDLTINKIAAGEVIERPASVVKELIENSIDAGAKNITIEIKNGGIGKIKISDDGCGIAEDDMEIAFERHATSKIRSAADLQKVMTMGFRGEALASIAAISRVEMISKRDKDEVGHRIVVEGGKTIEFKDAIRSRGTTITVQNLFYNTPVRYKFLKKDYTEAGYIEDTVTRVALVNKDVSIQLISNGKVVLNTNGSGDLKKLIYNIYGKDIANDVNEVDYTYENIHVTGVVGNPNLARGNRASQIFFLNGRYIKDKNLSAAADQAFKGIVPSGRYGFLILNMEMDASLVDVNVHPAKLEVRFQDENMAFKAIYNTIKSVFAQENLHEEPMAQDSVKNVAETISPVMPPQETVGAVTQEVPSYPDDEASKIGIGRGAKKAEKKAKRGLFSKNKKDEMDIIENNTLADIYKSRKEKMQTTDETDMLKVNINDILKEETETNAVSADTSATDNKNVDTSVVDKKDTETSVIDNKIQETQEVQVVAINEKEPSREETMSNQEKIAKFISDYHNRARRYNAEKLLKGIDEIVDKSGNIIETNESKSEESEKKKNFDDTTEFIAKGESLENVSTRELDSQEVNELVKNMNNEEKNLKMQETQIINLNDKDDENNTEIVDELQDANVKIEIEKVESSGEDVDVSNVEDEQNNEETELDSNSEEDKSTIAESVEISADIGVTEEIKDEDDEADIDNPYAFHISDIDRKDITAPIDNAQGFENDTQTDIQNTSNYSYNDTQKKIEDNINTGADEEKTSIDSAEENGNDNSETEKVKNKIFAKAKDEIDKFTSFAGGLLSSKIDNQNTELIDTKKVRDALERNKDDELAKASKDDFPGFAEMYKKTFGVEPFSIRKERKNKELEKEKYNASSEFSYANENVTIFEDEDDESEEDKEIQYKFIGQAFGNYIVIELKSEMYVVDISACKRRLIYEELKEKYYNDEEEGQMLLLPDVIILSKKELRLAQENIEMFEKAGFKYESFGENTIKLIAVPSVCEDLNTKQLFVEILDNLDTVAIIDTKEKEEKFLSIIALKIAANEIIEVDEEQSQNMLSQLLKYENPFTSPDGKPIAIKMTKNDLDKKFSRR